jgi:hypothetical protein
MAPDRAHGSRERNRVQEIVGGGAQGIGLAPPEQRIQAPGNARNDHQGRTQGLRRRHSRRDEVNEAEYRNRESGPRQGRETFARMQCDRKHREQHGTEQYERAGSHADGQVGKRKKYHVAEQRYDGTPVDRFACAAPPGPGDQQLQHDSPGNDTDAGKARRIDVPCTERHPAQQRIRRQREHCNTGKRERSLIRRPLVPGVFVFHPDSALQARTAVKYPKLGDSDFKCQAPYSPGT